MNACRTCPCLLACPLLESIELAFAYGDIDAFDLRARWAAPWPGDQLEHGHVLTGKHRLDAAVATVAHPAGDAEQTRLLGQRCAVADALDDAFDDEMTGDVRHANLGFICLDASKLKRG